MDLLHIMSILISIFIIVYVSYINTIRSRTNERFEDIAGDSEYSKQIEEYYNAEDTFIKKSVIQWANTSKYVWAKSNLKISVSNIQDAFPEDVNDYITILKDKHRELDSELLKEDISQEDITKASSMSSNEGNNIAVEFKKAVDAIKLDSLSSLKKRGETLIGLVDTIIQLNATILYKLKMLKDATSEPISVRGYVDYELSKFAKPVWKPLQFAVTRLAKVLSIGEHGEQKYDDAKGIQLALKELSNATHINDIDKFYALMNQPGGPKELQDTLGKLFSDPLSYTSLVQYMTGKFKDITEKMNKETFMDFSEGWEDSATLSSGKCIPCKIEPEVYDIHGIMKRYRILKDSYPTFKELLIKAQQMQAISVEIENKAKSGELMTEMAAAYKLE